MEIKEQRKVLGPDDYKRILVHEAKKYLDYLGETFIIEGTSEEYNLVTNILGSALAGFLGNTVKRECISAVSKEIFYEMLKTAHSVAEMRARQIEEEESKP